MCIEALFLPGQQAGDGNSEEDSQDFKLEVPVGHLTVRYLKADGSPQKDERCWISRLEGTKSVGGKLK